MSAGVRVRHATERNCMFTLVDGKRVYQTPFLCVVCARTHVQKTYHIVLDDTGSAIVAPEVWARLNALTGNGGFSMVNAVPHPPDQTTAIDRRVSFTGAEMTEVASGVTVRHPTLRSQRLVMVDDTQPYTVAYVCPECRAVHVNKTYHLTLDPTGSVTVSMEVARVLERLGMKSTPKPEPIRLVHAAQP